MTTTSASSGRGSSFPIFTRGSSRVERCHTDKTPSGTGKGLDSSMLLTILLLVVFRKGNPTMLTDLGGIVNRDWSMSRRMLPFSYSTNEAQRGVL